MLADRLITRSVCVRSCRAKHMSLLAISLTSSDKSVNWLRAKRYEAWNACASSLLLCSACIVVTMQLRFDTIVP